VPSGAGLCSGGHPGARFGSNYSTDLKDCFFELPNCWLWGRLLVGLEERKKQAKGKGDDFFSTPPKP